MTGEISVELTEEQKDFFKIEVAVTGYDAGLQEPREVLLEARFLPPQHGHRFLMEAPVIEDMKCVPVTHGRAS
ncbi:Hypothetical protein AA314_00029 [Archangium gephyra]|uniref:Uncharacterized protein n=1 Tax=Archangium gephyra TaxID=48 RepID=A0AAC8PZR7_9BACT|nr:Hypothetical protein AA314_00029 [Archangium gephyra]